MNSEWISNDDATERVKVLLENAGIPLELQVSEICSEFCDSHADANMRSEQIVYSTSESAESYREVDQRVQIYDELEIGTFTKLQLIVNLPIECKYRKDIEVFAFASEKQRIHQRFPSHSSLAGSTCFKRLHKAYRSLSHLEHASLVLLKIENGRTPHKVHHENLIYNAAGSLYDFVLFDITPESEANFKYIESLVDELSLFEEFQEYLRRKHYPWDSILNRWISEIDNKKHMQFNQLYYDGNPPYHMISLHLPVVCVNGPIYRVGWSTSSNIKSFHEIPCCLTSIRKRGWPGSAYAGLLTRNPEVPIVVTNHENLHCVLNLQIEWYQAIRKILLNMPDEIMNRWPLEAGFFQRAMRHYYPMEARHGYRSDLDRGI